MDASNKLPQRIGRYEVVGHLATGGMAEILLGRLLGPSGFERPVVIKRILPHLARSRQFVDMFLDEARIVARIRHRNVVQVHELGRDEGELFLVLEYLEGETVAGLLRRLWSLGRKIPPEVAAFIVAEACAGLHAAHELRNEAGELVGVVHRDVSPQNLFVTYDGQVKVIDFGIAKAADRIARTELGTLKGKSSYMSPEQCRGEAFDRRADIFALGSVFFELCTTTRLFHRNNQLLVFKAICEDPIPSICELRQPFPAVLDAVCAKALERGIDRRYATARDMRRDLLRALSELHVVEPEEAMASLMRAVFGDRVDEKQELLEQVKDGTVTRIPEAETDVGVHIPLAAPSVGATHKARRPTWRMPALAAAVLVSVGGAAVLSRSRGFGSEESADASSPAAPESSQAFLERPVEEPGPRPSQPFEPGIEPALEAPIAGSSQGAPSVGKAPPPMASGRQSRASRPASPPGRVPSAPSVKAPGATSATTAAAPSAGRSFGTFD